MAFRSSLIVARRSARAAELLGLVRRPGQVATRAVGVGNPFFERRRGLEEHVRELGPRYRSEQHRRGDDVEAEEEAGPGTRPRLQKGPDQAERCAAEKREDEQIRLRGAER